VSEPRRTKSGDEYRKVMSAARAEPLAPGPKAKASERLREGAIDTLLNAASILKEMVQDFRNSDRFFKYKAVVVAAWFVLSSTSIGVACSGGETTNALGARLVIAGDAREPIFMVKNDSERAWQDVEVVVNGAYRSTTTTVSPRDALTLSPVILFDASGKPAPRGLTISDIRVSARDPDEDVSLLISGQAP